MLIIVITFKKCKEESIIQNQIMTYKHICAKPFLGIWSLYQVFSSVPKYTYIFMICVVISTW